MDFDIVMLSNGSCCITCVTVVVLTFGCLPIAAESGVPSQEEGADASAKCSVFISIQGVSAVMYPLHFDSTYCANSREVG